MSYIKYALIPLFAEVVTCCIAFVSQNANAAAQISLNFVWAQLDFCITSIKK